MKTKEVYLGTIKKCHDVYWYSMYGDSRFIPDFDSAYLGDGMVKVYAEDVNKNAVLVRVSKNQYISLDMINSNLEEIMVDLGISNLSIYNFPSYNGCLFVDETTLSPFFQHVSEDEINVKTLKRLVKDDYYPKNR